MRLIDLRNDWLLQYAAETLLFDPSIVGPISSRLRRLQGYLTDTTIAFLVCSLPPSQWLKQPDPWNLLGELLARYEAEFSGRLLIDPHDLKLYRAEPEDSLTWGVLVVGGFDFLVREPAHLDRLSALHRRGVRVFQPVSCPDNGLGGSDAAGDDRRLTPLGQSFLDRLAQIAADSSPRSRPMIDLAGLNLRTTSQVLDWFSSDPARSDLLIPIHSHGVGPRLSSSEPDQSFIDLAAQLASLQGAIAIDPDPSAFASSQQLAHTIEQLAALPIGARAMTLSTNFLALEQVVADLDNVERLVRWASRAFAPDFSRDLIAGNAYKLIDRMLCVEA